MDNGKALFRGNDIAKEVVHALRLPLSYCIAQRMRWLGYGKGLHSIARAKQ
jgi:ABC-type iron transport system FetAB ATPase subunit